MDYKSVKISEDAKIARQSVVIGDVTIGRDSCVLHYAVIRGDDAPIVIGEESNAVSYTHLTLPTNSRV